MLFALALLVLPNGESRESIIVLLKLGLFIIDFNTEVFILLSILLIIHSDLSMWKDLYIFYRRS